MSKNSELRARFERLGPLPAAAPVPSHSEETAPVLLCREGPLHRPIDIMKRLRWAGVSLKTAHALVDRLAEHGTTVCQIPVDNDLLVLAHDLKPMNVSVHRRRVIAKPSTFIADLRARRGLSQRDLADALGLDVRTLQNWEQGRNEPDAAVLALMMLFDQSPEFVRQAVYEVAAEPVTETA
jgi:DNA-binding transcriptional regulator YiaG